MPRKVYQQKMLPDGTVNPLYIPQTNRHTKSGEEGYKPHSGGKSKHKSLFDRAHFIAWDGEGFDVDGSHVYGLLMNSHGDSLSNVSGLSTLSCLYLLSEVAHQNKNAIHVCYGASYDVNMILRDVPYEDLQFLYKGEKVIFDRYELEYRPRKSFIVRRMPEKKADQWRQKKDGNYEKVYESKVTLWDVLGFFQGTFVRALETYSIPADFDAIRAGKAKRGAFTPEELEGFIKPYCFEEVKALVLLMEKLHHNLQEADLKIARWDGAGACASALLKREGMKAHLAECPVPVQIAARHAYSGGRIEPLQYGHYEGSVHHYDINSAYPFAMLSLPSLANGEWAHFVNVHESPVKVDTFPAFSVWKVSWSFPETMPLYPFPYRTSGGSILFPPHGKNWIWYPELLAALETIPHAKKYIHIEEAWVFYPSTNEKPFFFLNDLFTLRAQWKREGNGAEKAMKLAINSVYGKMVQQLGYMLVDEKGKISGKPPYHQLEYGGYVTSYTRAQLFRACMQKPHSIISLATDGIYSTEPLNLSCSKELGDWDYHVHSNITLVTSGVYWYTDEGKEHAFYRGFDAGTLTRQAVLDAWEKGTHTINAPSTRFITLGAALLPNGGREAQQKRFKEWRTWKTIDRALSLDMTNVVKRLEVEDYKQAGKDFAYSHVIPPSQQLFKTRARTIRFLRTQVLPFRDTYMIEGQEVHILSAPYQLKWGMNTSNDHDTYIEGVPSFEYERQHLDTFI